MTCRNAPLHAGRRRPNVAMIILRCAWVEEHRSIGRHKVEGLSLVEEALSLSLEPISSEASLY